MKLNKKVCRKFAEPKWSMDLNHGLFCAEQIQYIVKSEVRNVDHQRVLILHIYDRKRWRQEKHVPCGPCFRAVNSISLLPAVMMAQPSGEAQLLTI